MKTASDFFRELLPWLNGGRVELLDSSRLVNQLSGLERRRTRGGRETIDHAPGAHDDVAAAAAMALVQAASDGTPALIRRSAVVAGGATEPGPSFTTFGVLWIDPWGRSAAVYASPRFGNDPRFAPMTILDVVAWREMGRDALSEAVLRLDGLTHEFFEKRRRRGSAALLYVPEAWTAHADAEMARAFQPRCDAGELTFASAEPIPAVYLSDPLKLLYSAKVHFETGGVGFTEHALRQTDALPFHGALSWSPSMRERPEDDALRMAVILAIALCLDVADQPMTPALATARMVTA